MEKIAIIGSGSWGTALGIYLAKRGKMINIWSFDEEEKKLINEQRKCKFLPEVEIPENIKCSTNMEEVVTGAEIIIHVTPSKFTRETVKKYKNYITENQILIMCSKGFEATTLLPLNKVVEEELPNIKYANLSGPSHAEEVSRGIPTAMVTASEDDKINEIVTNLFNIWSCFNSSNKNGIIRINISSNFICNINNIYTR